MLKIESKGFQADAIDQTAKWDREWCHYFSFEYSHNFFKNLSSESTKILVSQAQAAQFDERAFYHALAVGSVSFETWTKGTDIVNKAILEVGCGPGLFGKAVAKLASIYVGIDYSNLALNIARILSPRNASYYHISDLDRILALRGTIDTAVGRHFFIHQNIDNVRWILQLYMHALRTEGKAVLDFWLHPMKEKIEGVNTKDGMGPLSIEQASFVYYFSPSDIAAVIKEAGFVQISETEVPQAHRRFVTVQKR